MPNRGERRPEALLYGVVRFESGVTRRVRDIVITFDSVESADRFALEHGWARITRLPLCGSSSKSCRSPRRLEAGSTSTGRSLALGAATCCEPGIRRGVGGGGRASRRSEQIPANGYSAQKRLVVSNVGTPNSLIVPISAQAMRCRTCPSSAVTCRV